MCGICGSVGHPQGRAAIEAMVAPEVFQDAAKAIRSTTRRDARNIALIPMFVAGLLAGAFSGFLLVAPVLGRTGRSRA